MSSCPKGIGSAKNGVGDEAALCKLKASLREYRSNKYVVDFSMALTGECI